VLLGSLELSFTGLEKGIIFPEDSHLRRTGLLVGNFEKEPLRGTKTLSCGRGLKFVSPLRDTNSKTTH